MSKVFVTDVTLRDAHQCLIATRLRTEDMLPICPELDQIGFWALEVWGGATFDACLRFLKEDPWQRLTSLKKALPNTRLSMLLRGQNLVGYRHYADDVVHAFVERAAENGVDVFRVFDALNDIRNFKTSIEAVKKAGKHAQGALSYTTSPVHSVQQFVELAKQFEDLGCDSVAIKDMAGLLTPKVTEQLVSGLVKALSVPIHFHSHSTSGLSSICHYVAINHGCRHIDTALSSFSGGASHPCTESMVAGLNDTEYDTGLDLQKLQACGEYFKKVRKKYHQFESEATAIDPRVQLYQVPGGMISNLYNQLKDQNALDKFDQVQQEIPRVRKDLGYPPLVTPSSQVVGTQAVLNVITGERYKTVTNEVKLYCQGKYGKPPAAIDKSVQRKAIGNESVITCRPADLITDELPKLRQSLTDLADNEEDVLSVALFPEVGKEFLTQRKAGTLVPEPLEPIPTRSSQASEFTIALHGENYHVKLTGSGKAQAGFRPFYLTLDGVPEEVMVKALDQVESDKQIQQNHSARPAVTGPGDVTVAMPSKVIEIKVSVGDKVQAGDPLLVTEAMKMETDIQAPITGVIEHIHCQTGDAVTPGEALIQIKS